MRSRLFSIAFGGSLLLAALPCQAQDTKTKAAPADGTAIDFPGLQKRYAEEILPALEKGRRPEAADQLMFILFNTSARPVPGWYTDAKSRYDWIWLASRFDRNRDGKVRKAEFDGPEATWAKLDRDGDGAVSADDLDWTDASAYMKRQAQGQAQARRLLREVDADGDGQVSAEEWSAAYAKLAASGKKVDAIALRDGLYAPAPEANFERQSMTAEHRAERLTGILKGDVGSFNEGPDIGDLAPDFTLKTHDGKQMVKLSSLRGRPVVLTFGSFTCPPYRALFPGHEPLRARYGDGADFLAVYVREAHPTDGWHTAGNVEEKQPTTKEERLAVAGKFCALEKPSFPVLVDEMDDKVGHAYSGMPNRLYIIDRDGRVAYKSGRGPKGYKTAELEQSLVMLLLDQGTPYSSGSTALREAKAGK